MTKSKTKALFTALLLFIIFGNNAIAKEIPYDVALKVATNFMHHKTSEKLVFEDVTNRMGYTNFYVFNATNAAAFVIVAADDIIQPILAFSGENSFKTENMPENISDWLAGYEKQIQIAKDNNEEASEETEKEWKTLLDGGNIAKSDKAINALITTKWNQNQYYNNMCPLNNLGPGGHAYAGCAATAMAQVMKYWNYPEYGCGSHTYNFGPYQNPSADFANTRYDWNNMPIQLTSSNTSVQVNAVATLMYHCGVSVDMIYSYDGSAASPDTIAPALITYFRYSPNIQYVKKDDYAINTWATMLKTELYAGRPIIYGGDNGRTGHGFICDGYDYSYFFHFNWGWSGNNDGFYSLNDLAPGSGGSGAGSGTYTNNQSAIIGIQPSTNDIDKTESNDLTLYATQGRIILDGVNGEQVYVSDLLGRVVYNATVHERASIAVRNRGLYFVKVGSRPARKVVVAR